MSNIGQTVPIVQQQQALYDLMNGDAVSNATGTSSTSTDGGPSTATLTPEALMIYCQTRLQGIDSQIQASMTQQENINSEQTAIGTLLQQVANDTAAAGTNGLMNNPGECQGLEQNIENLITTIQAKDPGCSQLAQLETLHDTIMASGTGPYPDPVTGATHGYYYGGDPTKPPTANTPPPNVNASKDGTLGTQELNDYTSTLNSISSALGSGAEIGMIQIQSHMSDRTTAIQLTTSILQSYDDGLSKIADNIGK
jgi:hypothetical protein